MAAQNAGKALCGVFALLSSSGKAGVEVGTEKAWELCDKYNLPRMIYVTEMDVDDASFRQVVQDLTDKYVAEIDKMVTAKDQEIMSNYEYDKLYDELVELEKETGAEPADLQREAS